MMRCVRITLLLCALSACDVASVREAPSTITHNQCESNADCDKGECINNQCRSLSPTFQNILFEVTPPADGSPIAGTQFLIPNHDLTSGDSSLVLPQILQLSGQVTAQMFKCKPLFGEPGNELATANDSSIPAQVSLIPATRELGLYSPPLMVQAALREDKYYGFSVNVQPGFYDIYVLPNQQPDESCAVPPLLLRGQEFKKGISTLDIKLPEPLVFDFHVSWPRGDGALDGWTVDMVDSTTGRTISNRVPLALERGSTKEYGATLAYNPVLVGDKPASTDQWVRLSPPEDSPELAAPTVLMARSGLSLFQPNSGELTNFIALPKPVHVVGQVTSGSTAVPVAATITLVSTKITGIDEGVLATFTRTATVGADGHTFDAYLLPGEYRVSTVPELPLDPSRRNEIPLAADVRSWTVPSEPAEQQGKVVELGTALPITGRVVNASQKPVATAQVQASASPASITESNYLLELRRGAAFVPRASSGGLNASGDLVLRTDPGTFDISVRPNANTGFAWLVMPQVPVTVLGAGANLGTLTMPLPVSYGGTVMTGEGDAGVPVPGALVRAYIYLANGQYTSNADGNADSVLQVGETRSDSEGKYEVLIPAELNHLPE